MINVSMGTTAEDQPLTWKKVTRKGQRDTALLVCSNGHAGLIDEHMIDTFGNVTPSVVCTEDGCDFHAFIKLQAWEAR